MNQQIIKRNGEIRKGSELNKGKESGEHSEFVESLQKLLKEHRSLKHFRFFAGQAMKWYRSIQNGQIDSSVVILGTAVPEELVMASGEQPFRILGGSHASTLWSDDLVPRDTDPVSRSILGYVQCLTKTQTQSKSRSDILYIVPSYSDSMRKIADQLRQEGRKVLVVEIPPFRGDAQSQKNWVRQMVQLTESVAGHTRGRLTAASMKNAIRVASRARIALHEFTLMAPEYDMLLSASARILICNSYYYTQDLPLWTEKLRKLMAEIRQVALQKGLTQKEQPKILLMGSPVYFPNDKIPRLLSESGLRIWRQEDASLSVRQIIPKIGRFGHSLRKMTEAAASAWLRFDTSPAYLKNGALRRSIRELQSPWIGQPIEGVVFHILKGQIEPDFELLYFEELLAQAGIPVFRLETDYQYQDVEQLRIRIEAFTEMLNQKRYQSRKEVV